MVRAAMKLLYFVILVECCSQGTAQLQSCYDSTGCGGNQVTGVSTARNCCLGSGLSFRDGSRICRQCIVHGFVQTTDLVINEGATQEVITMTLDVKGNTLRETTRVTTFDFSFMCIDSSNGGGLEAVGPSDFSDTGCGSNIQLRLFPSAQRRSEVGISAVADDKIEGTEVLILRLILTRATQTAINNAGNIFFQDTLNIKVIDVTVVLIGFSEDDYTADEGEPGDVSRPNSACTVTVEVIERTLEIPLQIKLTPGEGSATRRDFNDTVILTEVPIAQTQLVQAIQIFDDEINEGREVFNVSLEVGSNISNAVQYRIQTTLCRIRQSDPIEIGFTQRRIFHTEEFRRFDTLINKSRASEQAFTPQVEISTLNSPFGQGATRGEDFQIWGGPIVLIILPIQHNRLFSYKIIGDNTPENQEVFQLSITPGIDSPTFTCTEANGCFQQLEIVIVDDDVVVVGFVDTLVEVNETDTQATLNVSISFPAPDPLLGLQIMFALRVDSMDCSAASHSALDTLRNPVPGVEDFPRIVDSTYYTLQEMPFDILEFCVLNQMFNETRRSQTFTFPIFVDDVPEGVEELQLNLSLRPDLQLPEGAVNVTPAVATVRIHDLSYTNATISPTSPSTPPPIAVTHTTLSPTTPLPTTTPTAGVLPTTPPTAGVLPTTPLPTTLSPTMMYTERPTVIIRPGIIKNIQAVNMEAFWNPPSESGGEITSYLARIRYTRSNGRRTTKYKRIRDPTVHQWKPDPFPSERPVYFQVRATNSVGYGPWSKQIVLAN